MRAGLSIGEFGALTHLSIRTLRRYHESGLLEPSEVDRVTGYRYYTAAQIPSAQVIHRLRQLEMPLPEVKAILATDDPSQRAQLIAAHLDRLEDELDRTRAAVTALRQLLTPEPRSLEVELRSLPARTVAAICGTTTRDAVLRWYADAVAELEAAHPATERTGPLGGRYANELFTEEFGDVMVFYPVRAPSTWGRIEIVDLPPVELAVAVHSGTHDDLAETYGRLGAWVVDHALAVAGPIHETYLVGPGDNALPESWRTEIGWPIFRLSPI